MRQDKYHVDMIIMFDDATHNMEIGCFSNVILFANYL